MKPTGAPTEKIMELYNQGLSIASICDIIDETPTVIEQTIFHELEKQERKAAKRAAKNAPILQVFSETNNVAETAKACNISKQLVYKVLKKNNVEPPRVHPAKATRKKEIAKYYNTCRSVAETAKAFNICKSTVYAALKDANVSPTETHRQKDSTEAIIADIMKSSRHRGWISEIAQKHNRSRQFIEQTAKRFNLK